MLLRVKIILAIFVAVGVVLLAINPRTYASKTEDWMERVVPESADGYTLNRTSSSHKECYNEDGTHRRGCSSIDCMDPMVYDILQPFGIVTRSYRSDQDGRSYEMVIIAGNTRKSFHDPQVCFSAQNWFFLTTQTRRIDIPAMGGEVPITALALKRPDIQATAMYFYRTPIGMRPSPGYVPFDLTAAKLMLKDNVDAQFYRFIVAPATTPRDDSRQAIEEALDQDLHALGAFAEAALHEFTLNEDSRYFIAEAN